MCPITKHPSWITFLLALSCGLIVANLYYAQPLIEPIAQHLNIPLNTAGLIVTLTQIGYGLGLLFVVPLGDLTENRRLVICCICLAIVGLYGVSFASSATFYFMATFLVGLGSVAVQILVPYAAHMATDANRGKIVGNVMSGLMLGIMLARPIASFVAEYLPWNTIFILSAVMMLLLCILLKKALPQRSPTVPVAYMDLLRSMWMLITSNRPLQRRALYQFSLFCVFTLFWTVIPLYLMHTFDFSQRDVAWFALAGVSGAIASPIAGRIADHGWIWPASCMAILTVIFSFVMTIFLSDSPIVNIIVLVIAAILLDFGVTANLVLGQRVIFSLNPAYRSRLNGLYMAVFFVGGAVGSALGGWSYMAGGWSYTAWFGISIPSVAFLYLLTERKR